MMSQTHVLFRSKNTFANKQASSVILSTQNKEGIWGANDTTAFGL